MSMQTPEFYAELREAIFDSVCQERFRQDAKWGEQSHTDEYWLGIFVEEVGEVAKAVIERNSASRDEEIIQAIAVLFSWLESMARRQESEA